MKAPVPKLSTGLTGSKLAGVWRLNRTNPPSPPSVSVQTTLPPAIRLLPLSWGPPNAILGSVGWVAIPSNCSVDKFEFKAVQETGGALANRNSPPAPPSNKRHDGRDVSAC